MYVLASTPELSIAQIEDMKEFTAQCYENYKVEKEGRPHAPWPPGAMRPGLRPVANATADIGTVLTRYSKAA